WPGVYARSPVKERLKSAFIARPNCVKLGALRLTGTPAARGAIGENAMSSPAYQPTTSHPTVRVDHDGPVTTIIIDLPEVRNAVDRPTAEALAHAFTEFEKDPKAAVAVLYGDGGYFCAGADLKGVAEGRGNRATPPAQNFNPLSIDAPMGPTRMRLSQPGIAAVAGHAVAGGLG